MSRPTPAIDGEKKKNWSFLVFFGEEEEREGREGREGEGTGGGGRAGGRKGWHAGVSHRHGPDVAREFGEFAGQRLRPAVSQILTVPAVSIPGLPQLDSTCRESADITTDSANPLPPSVCTSVHVAVLHTRTVPSSPPDTTNRPSQLAATELTLFLWPSRTWTREKESATRQTTMVWSADPEIRSRESGVNVTEYLSTQAPPPAREGSVTGRAATHATHGGRRRLALWAGDSRTARTNGIRCGHPTPRAPGRAVSVAINPARCDVATG